MNHVTVRVDGGTDQNRLVTVFYCMEFLNCFRTPDVGTHYNEF